MWRLIFSFLTIINILSFMYPFLVKFDVRFNILRLKGIIIFQLFNKIKFEYKIRIKHGYVYINYKNKERKEKISNKNINIIVIIELINQLYFRIQLLTFAVTSNFGYVLDSCVTAVGAGSIDVICKSMLTKIKNNKKSAHIFVIVEPKYNEDIFNVRIENEIRISIFDLIYTLIYTLINVWSVYEKRKSATRKRQKNREFN